MIVLVLLNLLSRLHHSESVRLVPSSLRHTIIDDEDKIEFIGHIIQKGDEGLATPEAATALVGEE